MRLGLFLIGCALLGVSGCGGGGVDTVNDPSSPNAANRDAAGTGDSTNDNAQSNDLPVKKRGTIGLSVLTLNNPFFGVIGDHMKAEAAKYGYDVIVVSGDQDPNKQLEQVQDFISKGCVAIVLVPCKSKVPAAIQAANKAGIPVFTTDSASLAENVKIECHIGTDNYGGGKLAGEAMIEVLGETGGDVAILDYPEAESCKLRVQGFAEVIDHYENDVRRNLSARIHREEAHRRDEKKKTSHARSIAANGRGDKAEWPVAPTYIANSRRMKTPARP